MQDTPQWLAKADEWPRRMRLCMQVWRKDRSRKACCVTLSPPPPPPMSCGAEDCAPACGVRPHLYTVMKSRTFLMRVKRCVMDATNTTRALPSTSFFSTRRVSV